MKVSIIIVTYNGMQWLERCLCSIPQFYEVVVVDNNSSDDTVAFIKSEYPHFKVFQESKNLGFGQANNKGISYALNHGADAVYLLNQDAYIIDTCIENLAQIQKDQPEYGILSPIHVNKEKSKLDRNFTVFLRYDKSPSFFSDFVLGRVKQSVYDVPFVNAAGWLISKDCLMTVGGFDPIFFHYGEDDNYSQRVLYHGFKIGVVPDSLMVHDREERPVTEVAKYSNQYFKLRERKLKLKYADLNMQDRQRLQNIDELINVTERQIIIAKLRLKFNLTSNLKRLLTLIKKNKKEIVASVAKNRTQAPHYLYITD